jgi:citrate/tricarballylate utilization protein
MARTIPLQLVQEGEQVMRICNACRYCEGFCAVFPAMERRQLLTSRDLTYLANLCHDCRECLYSCQYAPPHEFGVAVPRLMAAARRESYRSYAWPTALQSIFTRQWTLLAVAGLIAPLALMSLSTWLLPSRTLWAEHAGPGAFYTIVSHGWMVGGFGVLALFAFASLTIGLMRFWRDTEDRGGGDGALTTLATGVRDALTLRYLDGGGEGCAYPDEVASNARRWFHHLTFYGFMLCLAATTVAALYENLLGYVAPYPMSSVPVVLGSLGGVGLLAGPAGLLWLKRAIPPEGDDTQQKPMDVVFLLLLWLTAATGFLLLVLRDTTAMGVLLVVHLGVVAGLFATLPYGKFVHGIYRAAALVRYAREQASQSHS